MRSLFLLVLLAGAGTSSGKAQAMPESETASKIIALENAWNRAAETKNLRALDSILDDAFVYVDSEGTLLTKTDVLSFVKTSRKLQVSSESMMVRLHGDTAIVTGIYLTKSADHGRPFVRHDRFVDTWRHRNGVWVSIASLTTLTR